MTASLTGLNNSCLLACSTSQQRASVSQRRICSDKFTCCHTEIQDQTFCLARSQYTDTGSASPRTGPTTPGAWQSGHCSANVKITGMTRPRKIPKAGIESRIFCTRGGHLNHQATSARPGLEDTKTVDVSHTAVIGSEVFSVFLANTRCLRLCSLTYRCKVNWQTP